MGAVSEWSKVRSYRPGQWFAVLGEDVVVLLPPGERARAAMLWQLVDGGAEFAEVLDAVLSAGLRELAACALLDTSGATTTVVLRGPVRAVVDGDEELRLSGAEAATWVERLIPGVRRLLLEPADHAAEDGSDEEYQVDAGLVRVSVLQLGEGAQAPARAAYGPIGVVPEGDDEPEAAEDHLEPSSEPLREPPPATPPVPPAPDAGADEVDLPEADLSETPGPVPSDEAGADDEQDEDVTESIPLVRDEPPERGVPRLSLSDGSSVEVERPVIFGRAPRPERGTTDEEPILHTVPSPQQEISATHLEVRPAGDELVAIDLGSTNGTVLRPPGQSAQDLRPGQPVPLSPGAVLDLGDGLTIEVV